MPCSCSGYLQQEPSQHERRTHQDIDLIPKATQLHYVRKFGENHSFGNLTDGQKRRYTRGMAKEHLVEEGEGGNRDEHEGQGRGVALSSAQVVGRRRCGRGGRSGGSRAGGSGARRVGRRGGSAAGRRSGRGRASGGAGRRAGDRNALNLELLRVVRVIHGACVVDPESIGVALEIIRNSDGELVTRQAGAKLRDWCEGAARALHEMDSDRASSIVPGEKEGITGLKIRELAVGEKRPGQSSGRKGDNGSESELHFELRIGRLAKSIVVVYDSEWDCRSQKAGIRQVFGKLGKKGS